MEAVTGEAEASCIAELERELIEHMDGTGTIDKSVMFNSLKVKLCF